MYLYPIFAEEILTVPDEFRGILPISFLNFLLFANLFVPLQALFSVDKKMQLRSITASKLKETSKKAGGLVEKCLA